MADKEIVFDASEEFGSPAKGRSCGGNIPLFASLAALGVIVVGAFVALLVILDGLQLDAANRATTSAVRGALDFTATAIGAVFEETRVLALRLARDRQSGRYPSCTNDTASGDEIIFPLASSMNASITQVFGVYDVILAPGVTQTAAALSYTLCGVLSNTNEANLFRSSPPRVVTYRLGDFPKEVLSTQLGQWAGEAWNQTSEPYVRHIMTLGDGQLTPSATQVGDWALPSIWIPPSSGIATIYASVHVPVAYDGPTSAPSAAVSVDLFGSGFRPLLQEVQLEDTRGAIIDPRLGSVEALRRTDAPNGLLLASTFDDVPTFRNASGTLAMWPADRTPSSLLNGAVRTVVSHLPASHGLRGLTSAAAYSNGPDDTVVGAIPVVRPGRLRLVIILVTPHSVFNGNLKRGRKISGGVGAACGAVCLIALVTFVAETRLDELRARRLLRPKRSKQTIYHRLHRHPVLDLTVGAAPAANGRRAGCPPRDDPQMHRDSQREAIDEQYRELVGTLYPDHQQISLHDRGDSGVWRGLRVRAGVHHGLGSIVHDEVTKGYDYYGTVVNTAARIEGVAHGGQVLITEETYDAIAAAPSPLPASKYSARDDSANDHAVFSDYDVVRLGPQPLRGLDEMKTLIQVLPKSLSKRSFPPLRLDVEKVVEDENGDGGVTTECVAGTSVGSYNFDVNGTPLMAIKSPVQGARDAASSKPAFEQNVAVAEVIWRRHKVSMNLARFSLCCEAVRATLAPLSNVQRGTSLKTLAKRWRVAIADSTGAALADSVLIATIIARAAQNISVVGCDPADTIKPPRRCVPSTGTGEVKSLERSDNKASWFSTAAATAPPTASVPGANEGENELVLSSPTALE